MHGGDDGNNDTGYDRIGKGREEQERIAWDGIALDRIGYGGRDPQKYATPYPFGRSMFNLKLSKGSGFSHLFIVC